MPKSLLHPAYFGPIDQFSALLKAEDTLFENEDNYQKQTYRNRQYIYGANGKLLLSIPVKRHHGTEHQKYKEVKIDNSFHWQLDHWKSIQTAYRTSPYFEFYEDSFVPLYKESFTFLMDFNYKCLEVLSECLSIEFNYDKTEEYNVKTAEDIVDLRELIVSKRKNPKDQQRYSQVFEEKYGFLKNLSILDLLFNEGPNTVSYL